MHNGWVDPFAPPHKPPPNAAAGRPTFLISKGDSKTHGKLDKVRRKELVGLAAGMATTYARLAMTWDLVGLSQGMAISAHLWPAEFECIVIDYTLPVVGAESAQRVLYLCTRHRDARATGERPTLVEYIGLMDRTPCDDCNPWYFATWEVIPVNGEVQPALLAETI